MKNIIASLFNIIVFCFLLAQNAVADNNLKLHYTFSPENTTVRDISGNGYNGSLNNNAEQRNYGNHTVLSLGYQNGYVDMGVKTGELIKSLEDFTIATYLYLPQEIDISGNGNFVWAFSTHEFCNADVGKYIAYRVNRQRYAQSTGGWNHENCVVEKGWTATQGTWQHVVYTQSNSTGIIYLNGTVYASGETLLTPKNMGEPTIYNWIGKPHFSGDAYLHGSMLSDFRIYNKALTPGEIAELSKDLSELNQILIKEEINDAKNELELAGLSNVRTNMDLPGQINKVSITWKSSNTSFISDQGVVTRPAYGASEQQVVLTATLTKNGISDTKTFTVTVIPYSSDKESVDMDAENIVVNISSCLNQDIDLPSVGIENSSIIWQSDHPEYLSAKGKIISLPVKGVGSVDVVLTATIAKGTESAERKFTVCVAEDEGFSAYLFAYFTGNSGSAEAIRFALSTDGYNYKALNQDEPVIASDTISYKGGVRDPHILRSNDGNTFYMVVTDMKSDQGWNSNHGIVLLKSTDLIHWTHSKVDIKTRFSEFSTINRAWAPQTIYDPDNNKYMVYWSMRSGDNKDVIYYSYANDDFTDLETIPVKLFDHPTSTIDGDIIYMDGKYHLFFKTEGSGNGIKKAISDKLTGDYVLYDKYLQQTSNAVEGSCIFKLINSDTYILMYDMYTSGKYQFTKSTDLLNFSIVDSEVTMNFTPRHGTVIPITTEEANQLHNQWGNGNDIETILTTQSYTYKYYPNPVKDILYLDLCLNNGRARMLNLNGQILIEKSLSGENSLDCSMLDSGFYLLHITIGEQNMTFKIFKQ